MGSGSFVYRIRMADDMSAIPYQEITENKEVVDSLLAMNGKGKLQVDVGYIAHGWDEYDPA